MTHKTDLPPVEQVHNINDMDNPDSPSLPAEEIDFESREGIDEENAVPICISCMAEIPCDQILFCPDCGAPIDPLAGLLYFERTLAEGYILREACLRPRNRMTLFGILLFLGSFSIAIWGFVAALTILSSGVALVIVGIPALIPLVMIVRCIRSYRDYRKKEKRSSLLRESGDPMPEGKTSG